MIDRVTIQFLPARNTLKKIRDEAEHCQRRSLSVLYQQNFFKQAEETMISVLTRPVTRFGKEESG